MLASISKNTDAGDRDGVESTAARYQALIRVSEALRAYHDRDTLFRSLARELRPVVRFNFLGLALYGFSRAPATQAQSTTGEETYVPLSRS